jgi:Tol biopolymer transport system component
MGTAASATWSPDGTKIAYWAEGAPDALFVENADASNRIRVARDLWIATNIRPSWSLDSRRLVFSTESGPNRQDEDLWIVNADGTDLHRVARPGAQERRRLLAAWSPDGRWISFQAFPGRTQTEVSHLFVIRPDGTDEHEVVVPASSFWPPGPQWEPTLKAPRLAFAGSSRAPAATIYTYDVEADTLNVVGDGAAGMSSPAWSPDGRRLAWFTSDGFTGWISIASIDAPGAPPRRISPRGIVGVLVWSPDGSKLLGSNSDGTALIVIRADGSGQPTTIPHAGSQGNPSWQWVRP